MESKSSEPNEGGMTNQELAADQLSSLLSIVHSGKDESSDFPDRVYWTVDLADPKFLNKVVATDRQVTEVLAVADSLEELTETMSAPEFRKTLVERFDNEYLVHSGPTSKAVAKSAEQGTQSGGMDWRSRENGRDVERTGPGKT